MFKKYEKTVSNETINLSLPSRKKRPPDKDPIREGNVIYYTSVATGGYGDICVSLAEHTRNLSFEKF